MMRTFFRLSLVLIIPFLLISCNKDNRLFCKKGKGDIVTENRSAGEFTRIHLETFANVFVQVDEGYSVVVESYENIAPLIETSTSGSTLFISRDKCIRRTNDHINVYITVPELNEMLVDGSGNIIVRNTFNTFSLRNKIHGSGSITVNSNTQQMTSEITGSGNLHLTGSTGTHNVEISGSGDLRAYSLNTSEANIVISGSGNANVWVTSMLNANISGSGNIRYIGFPSVNAEISGSGLVLNMNGSDHKFD